MALEGLIRSGSPNCPQRAFAELDGSMGIHGDEMLRGSLPSNQTPIGYSSAPEVVIILRGQLVSGRN
jgi:hypothetical protein